MSPPAGASEGARTRDPGHENAIHEDEGEDLVGQGLVERGGEERDGRNWDGDDAHARRKASGSVIYRRRRTQWKAAMGKARKATSDGRRRAFVGRRMEGNV